MTFPLRAIMLTPSDLDPRLDDLRRTLEARLAAVKTGVESVPNGKPPRRDDAPGGGCT
jgi:hypothetical protein